MGLASCWLVARDAGTDVCSLRANCLVGVAVIMFASGVTAGMVSSEPGCGPLIATREPRHFRSVEGAARARKRRERF